MPSNALQAYLEKTPLKDINTNFVGYLANLSAVASVSPRIASRIVKELSDQRTHLKLIASENYCSLPSQLAMGNLLTDKYAEGFPGSRFYAGCENIDDIEALAVSEACRLFGAEHAYVQPHSGADANLVAFWAIMSAKVIAPSLAEFNESTSAKLNRNQWEQIRQRCGNQRLLALDYYSGGHLTHGYRQNVSAQMFDAYGYTVSQASGLLDYDEIEAKAIEVRPLILLVGYSAYPRAINFRRMRAIADKVGAVLMVDMAHFAGLVAGGVLAGENSPFPYADVVTTTTHKTLRGPRGGIVLCKKEFAEHVDKGCPLVLGGPLPHVIAAKAVALIEANKPEFKSYAAAILKNSRALAAACIQNGLSVLTGGTDNHLLLVDVRPFGLTGRQAETAVRSCGITLNRNSIPFDPNGPWYTSGLRVGTPAVTTLGMGVNEMKIIARALAVILKNTNPEVIRGGENDGLFSKSKFTIYDKAVSDVKHELAALLGQFSVYKELDLAFLTKHFCS